MDYEQLYYDSQYKIKKLESQIKLLEEEKNIYKTLMKNKDLKKIIASELIKYLKRCENGLTKN